MNPISLPNFFRSIICLSYEITQLNRDNNLLPDGAKDRGEYFFSDFGIPNPRPCTILAWASLLALGEPKELLQPGNQDSNVLRKWRVLLPFLPKIQFNEDTNQSLIRTAKAHARDSFDRILWGSIHIADSYSGQTLFELPHGNIIAKELCVRQAFSTTRFSTLTKSACPPLYATPHDGWSFGVVQPYANLSTSLRDPMIELAKHGIPSLSLFPRVPRVRRLLFRILDVRAAQSFAKAYAAALEVFCLGDSDLLRLDAMALASEIKTKEAQRFKDAASSARKGRPAKLILGDDSMAQLAGIADLLDSI